MDEIFFFRLILSFLIGGLWAILATIAADKYGSKIGGLITGLPSTGLVGLLFVAWTQSPETAVKATTIIPIVVGVECIFVVVYIYFVRKSFPLALFCAYLVWFVLTFGLLVIEFDNYLISWLVYIISLLVCGYTVERLLNVSSAKGKKVVYTPIRILFRGLLSGTVVAFIVFISKMAGPSYGGAFAAFPAMFLSTILITYFTHGAEFSAATMKSSVFSVMSLVIYTASVRYTYTTLGIIPGTLISVCVAFVTAAIIYRQILTRLK